MGQEIEVIRFNARDFAEFEQRLQAETALLAEWFRAGSFSARDRMGGFVHGVVAGRLKRSDGRCRTPGDGSTGSCPQAAWRT